MSFQKSKCNVSINCIINQNFYFENYLCKKAKDRFLKGISKKLFKKINQFYTCLKLKNSFDIVHPTYYEPYILGKYSGKMVLTVYGIIQERFPKSTFDNKYNMAYVADKIIAISESIKRGISGF